VPPLRLPPRPVHRATSDIGIRTPRRSGAEYRRFAGSDGVDRRAAILYGLVASCKRHRIDPFAYQSDVIDRVATHPVSRIAELLPATWKPPVPTKLPPLNSRATAVTPIAGRLRYYSYD